MKRALKIVMVSLLLLLATATITVLFFKKQLQSLVLHRLKAEMETTFGQYYRLEFEDLQTSLDFSHFSLRLIKPVFTTDTLQRAYLNRYPPVYFSADSLMVNGFNLRSLFFGKNIRLQEIVLANPSLLLLTRDSSRYDDRQGPPQRRRKLIENVFLGRLRIADGDIRVLNTHRLRDTVYYGKAIDLTLTDARLALQQTGHLVDQIQLKTFVFTMEKVVIQPINAVYAFEMERLIYDLVADSIHGKNMHLLPDRSLLRLSQQATYQKTFAKIALGDVALFGINYRALEERRVEVRKVSLQHARFFLLRNKNKVADPKLFKKSFPQALAALPIQLHIDSLILADMQLEYQLYLPDKSQPVIIRLTQANGLITQLHNSDTSKQRTQLRLKSRIMEHGKLDFQATFTPGRAEHSFEGQIYSMPFSDWNQVIAQMAPVQITSGTIDGIRFSGTAGAMESKGNIVFRYHDLRAGVNRTNKAGEVRKSSVLSGVANFILRENNPPKGKTEAESHVFNFRREPWQGPVMLWVGGLLDGMEATLLSEKNKARLAAVKLKRKQQTD